MDRDIVSESSYLESVAGTLTPAAALRVNP